MLTETVLTCEKALKSITLPCPMCGEAEAGIDIHLGGLDDDDAQFRCTSCENEFGRKQIAEIVRRWGKLLAWLENVPDCD